MKQSERRRLIEACTHVFVKSTSNTGIFLKRTRARVLSIGHDVVHVRFEEGTRMGETAKMRFNEVEAPEGTVLLPPRKPGRPRFDDPKYKNLEEPPAFARARLDATATATTVVQEADTTPAVHRGLGISVGTSVPLRLAGDVEVPLPPSAGLHLVQNVRTAWPGAAPQRPVEPPAAVTTATTPAHTVDAVDALSELSAWLAMGAELQPKLEVEISRVTQERKQMNQQQVELQAQIDAIEDDKALNQRKFDDLQRKLNMIKQFNTRGE